jgi:uncharacterized protein YdgA (DUF945 family)
MKKILILIIVLIVAWLGATWYTGTLVETKISESIDRFTAQLAKNPEVMDTVQLKQISYERGLFTSHARYAIANKLISPDENLLEINTTIWHGPFPLAALQQGDLSPRQFQSHTEMLTTAGPLKMVTGAIMGGKPPLVLDGSCSYGYHCVITGSIPPIDIDIPNKVKLSFGGVQIQQNGDYRSDTDYQVNGDIQLLPLSIGGQNFGSGQITFAGDPQSATELISWKTDKGESKLALALTITEPVPLGGNTLLTPEDLFRLIKTGSVNLSLSKAMTVDLAARAMSLAQGIDLATAQQQIDQQFDALSQNPQAAEFLRIQGDLLLSDWQYADGKLIVNGQERPDLLKKIKHAFAQRGLAEPDNEDNGGEGADSAAIPIPNAADSEK